MKSSKFILALWLGASAWAQSLPQKQQVNPPVTAMPSANSKVQRANDPGKRIAAPAKPAAAQLPKQAPASFAKGARKPAKGQPARAVIRRDVRIRKAVKPSYVRKEAAAVNRNPAPNLRSGRRDPFVSPVVERIHTATSCTGTGRQCLVVGEVSLHGVVRSPGGFIAVVMNGEHTYFLREHDPLADGAVERITKDTITLRERSSDSLGRPTTREVTKRLGVPAV